MNPSLDDPAALGHPAIMPALLLEHTALDLYLLRTVRSIDPGESRPELGAEQLIGGQPDRKRMLLDDADGRVGIDLIDLRPAMDDAEIGTAELDLTDFKCQPDFGTKAILLDDA